MRTPEQISKKMLNEEMTLVNLEMAIKKEQFRKSQKTNQNYEISKETLDYKMTSLSDESSLKDTSLLNRLLSKIGF